MQFENAADQLLRRSLERVSVLDQTLQRFRTALDSQSTKLDGLSVTKDSGKPHGLDNKQLPATKRDVNNKKIIASASVKADLTSSERNTSGSFSLSDLLKDNSSVTDELPNSTSIRGASPDILNSSLSPKKPSTFIANAEAQIASLERLQTRMSEINSKLMSQQRQLLDQQEEQVQKHAAKQMSYLNDLHERQSDWQISHIKKLQSFYNREMSDMISTSEKVHEKQLKLEENLQKVSLKTSKRRAIIKVVSPVHTNSDASSDSSPQKTSRKVKAVEKQPLKVVTPPSPPTKDDISESSTVDVKLKQIQSELKSQIDVLRQDYVSVMTAVQTLTKTLQTTDKVDNGPSELLSDAKRRLSDEVEKTELHLDGLSFQFAASRAAYNSPPQTSDKFDYQDVFRQIKDLGTKRDSILTGYSELDTLKAISVEPEWSTEEKMFVKSSASISDADPLEAIRIRKQVDLKINQVLFENKLDSANGDINSSFAKDSSKSRKPLPKTVIKQKPVQQSDKEAPKFKPVAQNIASNAKKPSKTLKSTSSSSLEETIKPQKKKTPVRSRSISPRKKLEYKRQPPPSLLPSANQTTESDISKVMELLAANSSATAPKVATGTNRPDSPSRPPNFYNVRLSNAPVFLRRTSIRPPSLSFLDYAVKKLEQVKSPRRGVSPVRDVLQNQSQNVHVYSTRLDLTNSPVVADSLRTSPVLQQKGGEHLKFTIPQIPDPKQNVSVSKTAAIPVQKPAPMTIDEALQTEQTKVSQATQVSKSPTPERATTGDSFSAPQWQPIVSEPHIHEAVPAKTANPTPIRLAEQVTPVSVQPERPHTQIFHQEKPKQPGIESSVQYSTPDKDASVQYSSQEEDSSSSHSWIQALQIQRPSNRQNPKQHKYKLPERDEFQDLNRDWTVSGDKRVVSTAVETKPPKPTDLERRIAEWIQNEVLLRMFVKSPKRVLVDEATISDREEVQVEVLPSDTEFPVQQEAPAAENPKLEEDESLIREWIESTIDEWINHDVRIVSHQSLFEMFEVERQEKERLLKERQEKQEEAERERRRLEEIELQELRDKSRAEREALLAELKALRVEVQVRESHAKNEAIDIAERAAREALERAKKAEEEAKAHAEQMERNALERVAKAEEESRSRLELEKKALIDEQRRKDAETRLEIERLGQRKQQDDEEMRLRLAKLEETLAKRAVDAKLTASTQLQQQTVQMQMEEPHSVTFVRKFTGDVNHEDPDLTTDTSSIPIDMEDPKLSSHSSSLEISSNAPKQNVSHMTTGDLMISTDTSSFGVSTFSTNISDGEVLTNLYSDGEVYGKLNVDAIQAILENNSAGQSNIGVGHPMVENVEGPITRVVSSSESISISDPTTSAGEVTSPGKASVAGVVEQQQPSTSSDERLALTESMHRSYADVVKQTLDSDEMGVAEDSVKHIENETFDDVIGGAATTADPTMLLNDETIEFAERHSRLPDPFAFLTDKRETKDRISQHEVSPNSHHDLSVTLERISMIAKTDEENDL